MQIAESKDRLTLIRQFIYSLGEFLSEFTVFYPLHDIITVRLIKLYSFLVDLRHYSFISILDIPVLQYIQSTGIHRPIQKCLYLLSYRNCIFPPPQFYKYILYYVLRFFITHDVEEAIILAQKVIIMSARPGRIKAIIDIDIPYPRTQETKMTPRFLELKNEIWSQVYQEYLEVRK